MYKCNMLRCSYLICVILTFGCFNCVCPSCVFQDGKYDLSSLDRTTGWPVWGPLINGSTTLYEINLCRPLNYSSPLKEGCPASSICQISGNNSISFGNALVETSDFAVADVGSGFSLFFVTKSVCKTHDSIGVYRATIIFSCGPHLGAPELMLSQKCQVNFYWRTSAACSSKPKNQEVPCYVIDDKGKKRDLSYLIRDKGGYFVNTRNPEMDFIINVCSPILSDEANHCPQNSSACKIMGDKYLSFGYLTGGLQYSQEGLILNYKTDEYNTEPPPECQLKPKTTVLFKCPPRGLSQPPKLISDSNCQYEVEWETEYACPENLLKGDLKACQFTVESHGVEIDLSPLKKKSLYDVKSNSSKFQLSVCGGLKDVRCEGKLWKSTSVCMIADNSSSTQIVGTMDGAKLMYADGEVMLTYLKGSMCKDGIQHSSVVNFICDPDAINDGDGEPQHLSSYNCVHVFEWRTKHACLKHPLDTSCSVTFDKKTVSLQKLLIIDEEPWEAIDRRNVPNKDNSEYYINVCGQVSNLGNLSSCGVGSSACVLHSDGRYINLGNFTSPPVYDAVSTSVRLLYTGGSPCKNGKFWESLIDFICRPGRINSEPVLMRIDETECRYEFEWHTAEACPEGMIEGADCKVYDSNLGINYDLTPLKSKTYVIDSGQFRFYLGVCEAVEDSPCSAHGNSSQNVGVCQFDKVNQSSLKTGEPSSHLSYMDGVVNLTYLSGDPYDNPSQTARMTIIIFICDYNAGNGSPYFVEVVNFAYVFHWYTSLVCMHSVSMECVVRDPFSHLMYDLSGLSVSKQNWMAVINDDNDEEKLIYLNVCRSLALPIGCDSNAAACVVKKTNNGEEVIISNVGRAVNPLVLNSPGHITLTYSHGNPCRAYGENITYSTVIHFLCAEDNNKDGLRFLSKIGACEYTFLWTTKAACPTGDLQSKESCQLTDPDSGFTFDLISLQRTNAPYILQSPNGTYQFNICGKVVNGCFPPDGSELPEDISVCKVDMNGKLISAIAVTHGYTLSYSAGRDLSLAYRSDIQSMGGDEQEVVIRFPCFNSSSDIKPKLVHQEIGQLIFEMKTPLTCIPSHFDCNVIDKYGNEYDLSPLAKYSNGNWEVADNRPQYSHLRYHINFCRPLNKIQSYKCPGGSSAACQTSTIESESYGHDLGSQLSEPLITDKGTVVIHYTGGSYCDSGQLKRSTTISLFCSSEEGELKFIGATPECEYIFSLETPVACPIQSSQGMNCLVKDPTFGYIFDLNPLKSKNNNYNVTVGDYIYSFNVCDKLNGFVGECGNSSVCQLKQKDSKFSKSLGRPNDSLIYRKGIITLEYKDGTGSCHGKYNRSTKITFTCHHAHEDKDGPSFVSEAEDCTYLFEWPTVHACPPFDVMECSVVDDNGVYYDLSKLSLPNDNYYVKNPLSDKKMFVINVCRSIVHTPDSLCPYTSGNCLIDPSKASEAISLGRVSQPPYFDNGKIKIKYTSGDHCNEEGVSSARFMETVIEFTCSEHNVDSDPEFIGRDGCTYYFDWPTAYACPVNNSGNAGNCVVEDPFTGYLYNLSSLKSHGLFKIQNANHQYYLNICGNNSSSPCGLESGMCQEELKGEKRHWNAGKANHNLMHNGRILYLNYSDGDFCHNGQFRRNTIIEFHCGHGIGEPKFVYESLDCTYFFSWKTEFACQTVLHCAVKNGSDYYDLTTLTESYHTAGSSVLNDNASYYISVCNSLQTIPGVPCPAGSAICRVTKDPQSSMFLAESLGKVEYPPFIDFMGHATVIYTNGSVCPKNAALQNRARIIFLCSADAGMGEPVLIEDDYDECLYIFEWLTSVVCPEKPEVPSVFTFCNYTDNSRGIYFNLLPLQKIGSKPYYEIPDGEKSDSSFLLNVCTNLHGSNLSKCSDSGVCAHEGSEVYSYGAASSQKFTFDGYRLRLTFYDGDDCPSGINGKRTSEIFFVCDTSVNIGEPVLHKKYTCLIVFLWKTSLVCQNTQQQCAFDINGNHYDFNLLSSLSHNWETTGGNKTYWINLCRGIQPTGYSLGCPPNSAVCMMNSDGFHMSLGMIQTTQVKPINSSDLLFTFESGDQKACSSVSSNVPLKPVTRLFMRCGTSLGSPKIFSGPDSKCFYDFVWESSLACANRAEQVMMEKDGIVKDNRLDFTFDIGSILNRTFSVPGFSNSEKYVYKINLSGVSSNSSDVLNHCAKAAVCQTKLNSPFLRDIGSYDTRTFILRGFELHLTLISHTKPCGKNRMKNVTTIFNMQCASAAGIGAPVFLYESGNCDYIFQWETIVVCPEFHRKKPDEEPIDNNILPNPFIEEPPSSHKAEIVVGVILAVIAIIVIAFIVMKGERRAIVSSRFRSLFGRVNLPYFRYKRGDILTELQSDF